jgi:hypothetical protein
MLFGRVLNFVARRSRVLAPAVYHHHRSAANTPFDGVKARVLACVRGTDAIARVPVCLCTQANFARTQTCFLL